MTDLLSVEVPLQFLGADARSRPVPAWWGKAALTLLLRAIAEQDPGLADSLHASPGGQAPASERNLRQVRPFTVSTLIGHSPGSALSGAGRYRLRLTALRADLVAVLLQVFKDGLLRPGNEIELDYYRFQVDPGWPAQGEQGLPAGCHSAEYGSLAAAWLRQDHDPPAQVRLRFTSPVSFHLDPMTQPLPLPGLVFGSLLRRWNELAPLQFPGDQQASFEQHVAVSRFELSSRAVQVSGGLLVGAVGEITYSVLKPERYLLAALHCLADFSCFSGCGQKTTMGMGQTEKI